MEKQGPESRLAGAPYKRSLVLKPQEDVSFVINTKMGCAFDDEAIIFLVPVDSNG